MTQLPNRDEIEKLIDPTWTAIVLEPSSRHEARRWLSVRAGAVGLSEERYLKPEKHPPQGSGAVRIEQTLTFRVDDVRCASDGRVTVRQSFELSPDCRPPVQRENTGEMIAQSPRLLWLRGKDALPRAARLAKELETTKLGRALAVPAYQLKEFDHWYAVDPWLLEIRPCSEAPLPDALRQDLIYDEDKKKRVYGGKWIAARFKKPQADTYAFSKRFRELVGDSATLGYRSLPLTVRSASAPPSDLYYHDGPSSSPGQDEPFGAIGLPGMWSAIATMSRSTVHVFLFDFGAESYGPDIHVNDEVSCTAIGMPPGVPLPMGEWSPWGGNLHGPQMASIMGASWAPDGAASMAGIFGHLPEISVVSVRCQSLPEMTAGLDHVTWFMKSGLSSKPENAVAVFGHDVLWACKVAKASPDPAVAAQVFAFEDALEEAQIPGSANPDVLAIMPVGNFSLGDAPTIPNVVNVGSSTLLVGACGLPTQSTRWIGSRWADTSTSPKPSLLAPGQSILAASQMGVYVRVNGTSFAAAHVAGVAAILRSVQPGKSALEIANLLKSSATALPLTPATAARPAGTPDPQSGSGRLNGGGAVGVL